MVSLQPTSLRMSEDQFLAWARTQEGRYELLAGKVRRLAGATRAHERVAKRIFMVLYAQVDERTFDLNKGGFGVQAPSASGSGTVLYPDIVIDPQSGAGGERSTCQPVVIIEVVSSRADCEPHIQKLDRYKAWDTLRHLAVFDHEEPRACVWTKTGDGWPARPVRIEGAGGIVNLPAIGAAITLDEIYRSHTYRTFAR